MVLRSDSELLVRQLRGEYKVRAPHLTELASQVERLLRSFEGVDFKHVPREANARADPLANEALDGALGKPVPVQDVAMRAAPAPPGLAAGRGAEGRPAPASGGDPVRADGDPTAGDATPGRAEAGPARPSEPDHGEACLLRVRYGETDQMGVVYYANYCDWFTEPRTELMRRCGIACALLERRGVFLPVREAHCEYLRPARYDQVIAVYARVTRLTRTRLDFAYEVRLVEDAADSTGPPARAGAGRAGPLLATGWTRHVFVDARGWPFDVTRRYPELWERLQRAVPAASVDDAHDGSA